MPVARGFNLCKAAKFGKGVPPGMSTGLKISAAVGAVAHGVTQSLYTVDGFIVHISHHICYSFTPSEDLITHRFQRFAYDQIHRNWGSDYDEKVLPLSERTYFLKAVAYGGTQSLYTVDGFIVHISHHICYSFTPSGDLITHRFERFAYDQINRNWGSDYDEKVLPLSEQTYFI